MIIFDLFQLANPDNKNICIIIGEPLGVVLQFSFLTVYWLLPSKNYRNKKNSSQSVISGT
jgi:hypothetical protein